MQEYQKPNIRPARALDVGDILDMIRQLAEFEHLLPEVTATEADLHRWLFGVDAAASSLICEWEGEPVAYAIYFRTFSTFLAQPGIFLEDLFVKEGFRNRGIGLAMLSHLAAMTIEKGYGRLQWAALRWNKNAIRLYAGLGAVEETDWGGHRLAGAALEKLASRA